MASMPPLQRVLLFAVLAAAGLRAPAGPAPAPVAARTAVLVELFTSEGCSSCPPADAVLAKLLRDQPVDGVEIIPLSLHVDYWNRLGWKDPFSAKVYSDRQQKYAKVFGEDKLYTPQIVVDGREEINGGDEAGVRRIVAGAASRTHLAMKVTARPADRAVTVSIDLPAAPAGAEPIDVLVALTEDDLATAVRRGENSGRTLSHVAVVRKLQTLGTLEREAFVADGRLPIDPAWKSAKMRAVVWLQGRTSNHVYGAAAAGWASR
jgi:hypothetical protein